MAVAGMTPFLDSSIGFEESGRGALKLLIENLNDELEDRYERWNQVDLQWQEMIGGGIGQTEVELVPPGHFHEGPRISLLKALPEAFPVVSVFTYRSDFTADKPDQLESSNLRIAIEAATRSGPVAEGSEPEHETIVHRRISRLAESINAVIMRDKTLCSTVKPGISGLDTAGLMPQAWLQREEKGRGPKHLWQGARLEYRPQRHSIFN